MISGRVATSSRATRKVKVAEGRGGRRGSKDWGPPPPWWIGEEKRKKKQAEEAKKKAQSQGGNAGASAPGGKAKGAGQGDRPPNQQKQKDKVGQAAPTLG
jgi:hypothetical protein